MTLSIPFLEHPTEKGVFLITGEFHDAQLYEYEYQASRLAARLREILARTDDPFTEGYAEILVYTVNLRFEFESLQGNVPEGLKALQAWWLMVQDGKPIHDTYLFMASKVHGRVIRELRSAMNRATRLWTSPVEKSFLELTEQEQADPN